MEPSLKEIERIYHAALEKGSEPTRDAYLAEACGGNAALRSRVEALLRADERAGDFLEIPALDSNVTLDKSTLSEGPGTVIGRYKLLERIGEGGMAVVYMAEQAEPIRRKVALKVIKLGMDTKQVIARFEAERQALAMMDHPNIAKVLDAGATETGRPYFVMELVTGVSITEYCDKNKLSTRDRLALFLQVCNAVQHAHQKGIIHRDLKPSNVMVAHHDGQPVPKVIDFGIAKATNQRLTEKTLFTRYAHIIGTPAYMSPEQAELSDLGIDTRSDIYSLGVLLYELLTGATPFSEDELRQAGYLEMQRIIRQEEPVRPSTKLTTLGETLTDIAKRRGCTPDLLTKTVRGDLDWIVMKALEKERARRYETAHAFAIDVQRHLHSEPVLARGPSAAYRLQKFLHRHRVEARVIATIAVVAVAMGVILSMWNRDRVQLSEAERFRDRGILSQAREQYARGERDTALETIQPILASEHVGSEAQLLRAGILVDSRHPEEAVTVLEGLLDHPPEIAGAAHALLARILWENASPDANGLEKIETHRQKAEALLPETAEAYFLRAMTALTVKEQLASLDRALQLDPSHYESRRLRAFTYSASRKYDRLQDEAMVMTVLRPRDPLGYSLRAAAWRGLGRYPKAIADYDKAIALTLPTDPQYVNLIVQRSEVFLHKGDYERVISEATLEEPNLPALQYHAFGALTALGQYEEASTLFRRIIEPGHEARQALEQWCMKYVFDTLEAERSWHPAESQPPGPAFLAMLEAGATHRSLSAKARRLITDGFRAGWSPDGSKLAFSLGVHGYSGVAIYDRATQETDLLIVPGKDPTWSPDGENIAFIRDCQVLRLADLAEAGRTDQHRPAEDEEVWLMKSDGTEPRRLTQGSAPSWGPDSKHLYYLSRADGWLCCLSVTEPSAKPKRIMNCGNRIPSVSPDNQHVAYFEGGSFKIRDLASDTLVAEYAMPFLAWGGPTWSPTCEEVFLGGSNQERERTGLWVYNLAGKKFGRILDGQVKNVWWSARGEDLALCLSVPYREIWTTHIDPNVPAIDTLGPARTVDEHLADMVAFYTRRIEADPQDASAYSRRAQYHDYLGNRREAAADMRRWSAVASGGLPSDLPFTPWQKLRHVVDLPFDCQLVFSAERPVNAIPMMSISVRQKGRCEMKLFEIPMLATSLAAICLLSGLDAPPVYADFTFGEATILGPHINTSGREVGPLITPDGLSLYFARSEGDKDYETWLATRATNDDPWGDPVNLGKWTESFYNRFDIWPGLTTADGLELYSSARDREGGYGSLDLWMKRRDSRDSEWGPWINLGPTVNSWADEMAPFLSPDGLELYFSGYSASDYVRPGGQGSSDLWVTRRTTRGDPWGEPENLGPTVNSPAGDWRPWLSGDGLLLFFDSYRPGGSGSSDLYVAGRESVSAPWEFPMNLGPLINSSSFEQCACISANGTTLYYDTGRPGYGNHDIWEVSILRVVDFNGDDKVDSKDSSILVDHWLQDEPLCDIGPLPWGDGIVDEQDLLVLAEHLEPGYQCVARWRLDETEGTVAADGVGEHDGHVSGEAVWQPEGGKVGGALEFDGVDDYVTTDFVLDPAENPFRVLAWVNGDVAGQVIAAQSPGNMVGSIWLGTDPLDGTLMTELMAPQPVLDSGMVITDGQWHEVMLEWDGRRRHLYADGTEVAADRTDLVGVGCDGWLDIGAAGSARPETFWAGLIDDVRVETRTPKP